jgi:deoxyribonuclease-4
MSTAGGVSTGLERAKRINIDAVQIFTKNNNRWFESPTPPEQVERFRTLAAQFDRANLFSHAGYLINVASPDDALHERSMEALQDELMRAESLGLSWVVLHPGSHVGKGEDWGLKRVIDSLNAALDRTKGFAVGILLETTAGQGSALGYRFEHLARMRRRLKQAKRVGICVDTCHIFAAGYDIRDEKTYSATIDELDRVIGIKHVKAWHLNDSVKPLGSKVDRHAHIGEGEIGLRGFSHLMNDTRFSHLPMVLETPKGPDMKEDVENLNRLRSLIGGSKLKGKQHASKNAALSLSKEKRPVALSGVEGLAAAKKRSSRRPATKQK